MAELFTAERFATASLQSGHYPFLKEEAMATYAAVSSRTDDWGETIDRFK